MTGYRYKNIACVFVVIGLACAAATAADTRFRGRPVVDVLLELRDPGLDFIFSSRLVPARLRVVAEPTTQNRLRIAREILTAHGLALSAVRPGLYAVVAAKRESRKLVLRGRVLDALGQPIATARVSLLPIGAVGWSDAEGRFAIGPVPEGNYTLRAEANGFESSEWPGTAVSTTASAPELRLTTARSQLSEVVVSTSRYAVDRSDSIGSLHIGGDLLAVQPVIGEDALRTLGRLPGIAQSGVSAQSSIRGGEAGELLTLLDGFPLRQAFHMPAYQGVFGVLDPGLVEDAEIYTGGFPVRYGNRMAGVFDLRTIDAASEPRTALGLSVFNAMARNGGEFAGSNADWLGSARVGTLRPFIEAFGDGATTPTYADVYTRASLGTPDLLRVSANLLWSRDELAIARKGHGERAQIESRTRYLWLRGDREWDGGVQASLWLGHSTVDGFRTGSIDKPGIAVGDVADRRSSEYRELRGRIAWEPRSRHWFEGGFEWTGEDGRYRYAANAEYAASVADLFSRDAALTRATNLSPDRERIALFASHRWRILDGLTSELGLRAQRTIARGRPAESWLLDPRFSIRWQLAPSTDLRAHWGRFHQTDEVHELKVEDGLTSFPEAQRSDHFIVGLDHQLQRGPALRLEWFRKVQADPRPHFENILDPLTVLPEIAPDRTLVAPLSAEVRGTEFSVISTGAGATWWLGLSWSEAWDGVDGRRVPRSWDQSWAATAGIDWTRRDWRFGAVAGAHRGWPTTRIRESVLGERNAVRFPTRITLDLRTEHRRPLAVGSLALTFELSNAINIGNTCCYKLIASEDGADGVTFTTRTSDWLPLVPSVGILWEF
ncbi:MAG: TonB-dependent receptor [Steroidobacteraceae bacterium]